jgi:hypothetical protein
MLHGLDAADICTLSIPFCTVYDLDGREEEIDQSSFVGKNVFVGL